MEKKSNGVLVGILIGIIIILIAIIVLFETNVINFKSEKNDNSSGNNNDNVDEILLSEEEAIDIGKKLYDKATEVYSTTVMVPYCGTNYSDISNKDKVTFGKVDGFYDSGFAGIDDLKKELSNWFSQENINKMFTDYDVVTDLSLLDSDGMEYTNFVVTNGKLYCGSNVGKGWLSLYLGKYDIKVNHIDLNKIVFDIDNYYAKGDASNSCIDNAGAFQNNIDKCNENEIEKRSTQFVIGKNNSGNFVVNSYTLHD